MMNQEYQEFLKIAQSSPRLYKTVKEQENYATRWYNMYLKLVDNDESRRQMFWIFLDDYIDRGIGVVLGRFGRVLKGEIVW